MTAGTSTSSSDSPPPHSYRPSAFPAKASRRRRPAGVAASEAKLEGAEIGGADGIWPHNAATSQPHGSWPSPERHGHSKAA